MRVWTPLPLASYREVARRLSSRDLADARVSARRALEALLAGDEDGVPALWHGHGPALVAYCVALCDEWEARGYRDGVRERVVARAAARLNQSEEAVLATAHEDALRTMEMLPVVPLAVQEDDRRLLAERDPLWYEQWGWVKRRESTPGKVEQEDAPRDELAERRTAKEKERRTMATRTQVVDALREKGYAGPVSYSKTKLEEMLAVVESGGTVDTPKRGRKPRENGTPAGDSKEGD